MSSRSDRAANYTHNITITSNKNGLSAAGIYLYKQWKSAEVKRAYKPYESPNITGYALSPISSEKYEYFVEVPSRPRK